MKLLEERNWLIYAFIPLGVGIVFGLAQASSATNTLEALGPSLVKATGYAIIIWAVLYPVMAMVTAAFHKRHAPLLLRQVLSCFIAALPLSFIFAWIHNTLGLGADTAEITWMSIAEYDDLIFQRYFKVSVAITPLWTLLTYKWYLQQEQKIQTPNPVVEEEITLEPTTTTNLEPKRPAPAFIEKMTKPIGREPWAIKAEQHYIRIYTQLGDEMVLYRFSDAIKGLEGFDGLQVHRSYWVAINAIESIENGGSSMTLKLKNEIEVPVSKSYRKQVEALKL